jgi:hypothetical protein
MPVAATGRHDQTEPLRDVVVLFQDRSQLIFFAIQTGPPRFLVEGSDDKILAADHFRSELLEADHQRVQLLIGDHFLSPRPSPLASGGEG